MLEFGFLFPCNTLNISSSRFQSSFCGLGIFLSLRSFCCLNHSEISFWFLKAKLLGLIFPNLFEIDSICPAYRQHFVPKTCFSCFPCLCSHYALWPLV
eukprot:TRINITY_DN3812_c0_g1_i1.p3 TRINITY_DN3812_c0_g1~~TRINITY_DN3812_c0_g1_i1.p3  ORF type:complete len:98 (+),score=5.81 TRINITY_DN3812_c0_g1_i1:174-467(+)